MTIKENHWLNKFYKKTYNRSSNQENFCDWFWSLIPALLLLPATALTYINFISDSIGRDAALFYRTIIGAMINFFIILIGTSAYREPKMFLNSIVILLIVIVILSVLFFVIYLMVDFKERRNLKKYELMRDGKVVPLTMFQMIKEAIKAKKEKYCPKIKWI